MKKVYLLAALPFFLYYSNLAAQERVDTIYYDKDWKGISNPSFADFYRIALYPADENYKKQFRDYYITGELYATGGFSSIDKFDDSNSVFDGESIIYFKNGKTQCKRIFQNGKLNGEFYEYFEDGLMKVKTNLFNGEWHGLYTEFFEDGNFAQAEYVNGEPKYNYYIMSNPSGQVVKISFSDNQPIWESPYVSERKVRYKDGTPWQYYEKNGLMVAQTNTTTTDYGKWHKVDIIISNNSMIPIEFDPVRNIVAYSIDKKEKIKELGVWSSEEYMKKVKRSQNWQALAVGITEGLATVSAGYSTSTTNTNSYYSGRSNSYGRASAFGSGGYAYGSYSGNSSYSGSTNTRSTTTSYDAAAAYQTRILSQQRMADFSEAQWNERNEKQMGYLKKNTIYPGETIQGYVYIQRISGKSIHITLNINGANHIYGWGY